MSIQFLEFREVAQEALDVLIAAVELHVDGDLRERLVEVRDRRRPSWVRGASDVHWPAGDRRRAGSGAGRSTIARIRVALQEIS